MDEKKVKVVIKPPRDKMKPFIVVDNEQGVELPDEEATVQCPKYNFAHALIARVCVNCQHFGGLEPAIDSGTGRTVPPGTSFYNGTAVKCAYPLQRRIYPPQKVIREG